MAHPGADSDVTRRRRFWSLAVPSRFHYSRLCLHSVFLCWPQSRSKRFNFAERCWTRSNPENEIEPVLVLRILARQMYASRRASRFRLAETTPAVLQFQDSSVTPCKLQKISRTGGVLSLPKAVDQGSVATLMFRTHKGDRSWRQQKCCHPCLESSTVPLCGA
jgi:hypothetical protein